MKIFSAPQLKDWDQYTILHEPIPSIQLMERASQACLEWILNNYSASNFFTIYCGKGNNGGDGLALARLLATAGKTVQLHILEFGYPGTLDFQQNLARIHQFPTIQIHYIQELNHLYPIKPDSIVVDALVGSGLNRPLEGLSKAVVSFINQCHNPVIAIDVPSGLFCDQSSMECEVIQATHTLSFSPKLSFYLPENKARIGDVHLMNIGLAPNFLKETEARFELITRQLSLRYIKPRPLYSHKGNYGHALLIAGNTGKMGAGVLAARSAIRSGVGLLSCYVPFSENLIMQVAVPEAMTITEKMHHGFFNSNATSLPFHAVAIGPGFGTGPEQESLLEQLFNNYRKPLVIDADALTVLSNNVSLLKKIPPGSILTPHPGEFKRLFGESKNDFERIDLAIKMASTLKVVIVLKGHHTLVVSPQAPYYFNTTGNPGMAKGGTGDALTGIILALLAQGYSSIEASILGVFIHGKAGDLAAEKYTSFGMSTSDLIDSLGVAWKELIYSE